MRLIKSLMLAMLLLAVGISNAQDHSFVVNTYYVDYPQQQDYITLMVEPLRLEAELLPCQPANFSFIITNPSLKTQFYEFELKGFMGTAYLSPNLIVPARESRIVNYVLEPDCSVYGETLNPVLRIDSDKEYVEIPLVLTIEKDYSYKVAVPEEVVICNDVDTVIPVSVLNSAHVENRFYVETDREWAELEYGYVDVKPANEAVFDLVLSPRFDTEVSTMLTLDVNPDKGERSSSRIKVTSKNCYGQEIRIEHKEICEDTEYISVLIRNTGLSNMTFYLNAEGSFIFENGSVDIMSGETVSVPVKVVSPKDKETLTITSTMKETGLTETASEEITVRPLLDCYEPRLLTQNIRTIAGGEHLLEISNEGLRDENYFVEISGPQWLTTEDSEIYVIKGVSNVLKVHTENPPDGRYTANLILTSQTTLNKYVEEFTINVGELDILRWLLTHRCYIVLFGLLALAALFFLKFLLDLLGEDSKKPLIDLIAIIVLLILTLIVVNLCFDIFGSGLQRQTTNETSNSCLAHYDQDMCDSDYYVPFEEDSKYTLELSDWFYDPDGDTLEYSASHTPYLDVSMRGGSAVLVPADDWYGTEELKFIASDERGGFVESRAYYIHVLDKKEFSFSEFLLDYHVHVSLVLILILLVLLVILILKALA